MIETVFLDLDDTLLDFHRAEAAALRRALTEMDVTPTEEIISLYSRINDAQWKRLERGELTRAEVMHDRFALFYEALGISRDVRRTMTLYEGYLGQGHYFMPHAEEVLALLYPRYTLCITSNGTERIQRGRLESAGLARFCRKFFISETIGYNKPDPRFFDACFAALPQARRESTVIIGDSLTSDILGGKNAGIRTCLYNPREKENKTDIRPDYTISDLGQLPELLASL